MNAGDSYMNEDKILKINKRSFITVCIILLFVMLVSYILTFFIQHGQFVDNDVNKYQTIEGNGLPFYKFLLSPILVLGSSSSLTIIVISLFLLILGGSFNVIDKTGGINAIIWLFNKQI